MFFSLGVVLKLPPLERLPLVLSGEVMTLDAVLLLLTRTTLAAAAACAAACAAAAAAITCGGGRVDTTSTRDFFAATICGGKADLKQEIF